MKKVLSIIVGCFILNGQVFANECSLYSNTEIKETAQANRLHIPKQEVEPVIISDNEFKKICNGVEYCHTKDAIYTAFKKQSGTTTSPQRSIEKIEFIGEEYDTSKKAETFVDVYELKGAFSIKNDLMVCGYKDQVLYLKLPVEPTRMSLFNELISPNSVFSRNHISEFENQIIQDI